MRNILFIDPEKCTGCRICEVHCSFAKTETCNPARSRIRVIKREEAGINVPVTCQQCEKAPCLLVCPVLAVEKEPESGMVTIAPDICIGCMRCIMVCPFGAISIDPVEHKVIKCDLCGGEPVCAQMCPTEAISFLRADRVALRKKREGMEKLISLMRLTQARTIGGG